MIIFYHLIGKTYQLMLSIFEINQAIRLFFTYKQF